jgi:hypothetical protein
MSRPTVHLYRKRYLPSDVIAGAAYHARDCEKTDCFLCDDFFDHKDDCVVRFCDCTLFPTPGVTAHG